MIIPQMQNNRSQTPVQAQAQTHARLSASGAHRWAHCAASAAMEEGYPDESTTYAKEGTAAHELAAYCLLTGFNADAFLGTSRLVEGEMFFVDTNMAGHVQTYIDYIRSLGGDHHIEQRVDFSHVVPDGFGTSDAVIFKDNTLYIVDLKYGQGVRVEAENNDQALLYAIGALAEYGFIYDNIERVKMVIVQPRLDHIDEWEITVDELKQHEERFREAAALASSENAPFSPSEKACRFCKAKADCKALAEHNIALAVDGFEQIEPEMPTRDTDKLTAEELAQILDNLDNLKNWISAVEARAQALLESGEDIPGYKLVEGRSLRRWSDESEAIAALEAAGVAPSDYLETKLASPAKLEKLIGKNHDVIKVYAVKPRGKPVVAKTDDKRPAITIDPAAGFTATA